MNVLKIFVQSKLFALVAIILPLIVAPLLVYLRKPETGLALWFWAAALAVALLVWALPHILGSTSETHARIGYWLSAACILLFIILLLITSVLFFKISPMAGLCLLLPPAFWLLDKFLHFHP